MAKINESEKKPQIPQKDAVKKLRDLFEKRKREIHPSADMDEVVIPESQEDNLRKIAKPERKPDLDL